MNFYEKPASYLIEIKYECVDVPIYNVDAHHNWYQVTYWDAKTFYDL